MSTTAEEFGALVWVRFQFGGYTIAAKQNTVGVSNYTQDFQRLTPGVTYVQTRCRTDRWIGPTEYSEVARGQRKPVIRLDVDFWRRLPDTESEEDVIGPSGVMHSDFALWGSVEYWRDTYPAKGNEGYAILDVDTDNPPVFDAESIEGILMHWSISIGLIGVP